MAKFGELLCWWGVAVGVWLLTLSSVGTAELVVAALCGLPCAVAGRTGRVAVGDRWVPRARWMWWPVPLVAVVVADAVRILPVPVRRLRRGEPRGELRELRLRAVSPPTSRPPAARWRP